MEEPNISEEIKITISKKGYQVSKNNSHFICKKSAELLCCLEKILTQEELYQLEDTLLYLMKSKKT